MMRQQRYRLAVLLCLFDLYFLVIVSGQAEEGSTTTMSPFEDCDENPAPGNGAVVEDDTAHGSVVTVLCNEGYFNIGAEQLICSNGVWEPAGNGDDPQCVWQCGSPQPLENGNVALITNGCTYATCVAQYTCDTGYTLSGEETLTCQLSGWSDDSQTCQIVDCGAPDVDNGDHNGSTTYESEVTFNCDNRYVEAGPSTAICDADGNWSDLPSCLFDCGALETIEDATQVNSCTEDQLEGCTVTVTCNSGFTLTGSDTVECRARRGWSFSPICLPPNPANVVRATLIIVSPPVEERQVFEVAFINALIIFYRNTMGNSFVGITGIIFQYTSNGRRRKRQDGNGEVEVGYSLETDGSDQAVGQFAEAQTQLMTEQALVVDGQPIEPLSTVVSGVTVERPAEGDTVAAAEQSCKLFEAIVGECPSGTQCVLIEVDGDSTILCESTGDDDGDFALKVGLGVGIPLFLLTCALICTVAYFIHLTKSRRRRRHIRKRYEREDSDSATASGFTPTRVPTRFNPGGRTGPVYGSYFPEAWNEAASIADEDLRDPQYHYDNPRVVSVGYSDAPKRSTFSWDFMYPRLTEDFSMPRPRV